MKIHDMHCHVDLMPSMLEFGQDAQRAGINLLAMTTTPKAFVIEKNVLRACPNVKVALGLHPQLVSQRHLELALVEDAIHETRFVGEIGLDFNMQYYSSKKRQLEVFSQITKWCQASPGKVISIHSVRSDKDVLDILEKNACTMNNTCLLHWYSGSLAQLRRAVDLGCFFSVNEYMLNSTRGRAIIEKIPSERLLLESDAPFVSGIQTVEKLKQSLRNCLNELSIIKGRDVSTSIFETSQRLFETH